MRRTERVLQRLLAVVLSASPLAAFGQSIAFSPAAPSASDAIGIAFNEPFDCGAPTPTLAQRSVDSLAFESVLPNGIVNCAAIPVPPPLVSRFDVPVGTLAAGTYAVTWKIYRAQSSGAPQLLSSTSASLTVAAGRPEGATVVSTPALSIRTLALLAALCSLLALARLRSQ